MNIWDILDISPTGDEVEIRRAYARQLKNHRPDSDPVGYQQLREAFDAAKHQIQHSGAFIIVGEEDISALHLATPAAPVAVIQDLSMGTVPADEVFYSTEKIQALARQLVNEEMSGIVVLNRIWAKVSKKGSLLQQQLFHQDLASALAEVPELTEGLLERVAGLLGWRLDEYDYSHTIPFPVQHAIQVRLRETEVNRVLKRMEVEEKQGEFLNKIAIRLFKSDREKVPFWVRLVPNLLQTLAQQANKLHLYPEIASQLNSAMWQFLSQPRLGITWQGSFLLVFWVMLFSFAIPVSGAGTALSITAITTVFFYLYFSNMLMLGLHGRKRWLKSFLYAEFIFSLIIIQLFFGGLFFAAVITIGPSGHGGKALSALLACLALCGMFWMAWPKGGPFIRKPGIVMSRMFSGSWIMMEQMKFAWFSVLWIMFYFVISVIASIELLKLFV